MNCILLAAGMSVRMGVQKLLLPFGGSTVLETVIANLKSAGLLPIYAVLSAEVAEKLTSHRPSWLRVGINSDPKRGQSSSLAIGLEMLPDGNDFCIMLGDLPLAEPKDMTALATSFNAMPEGKTVLAPSREGVFGHPMFYRPVWKERFRSAFGDAGGKNILLGYEEEIVRVNAPDGHFRDIDTPEDYRKLTGN